MVKTSTAPFLDDPRPRLARANAYPDPVLALPAIWARSVCSGRLRIVAVRNAAPGNADVYGNSHHLDSVGGRGHLQHAEAPRLLDRLRGIRLRLPLGHLRQLAVARRFHIGSREIA